MLQRKSGSSLSWAACAALSILLSALQAQAGVVVNAAGVVVTASARARDNASRARQEEASLLSAGVKVGREIKGGETHLFGVALEAGQYARINVRRLGVDLLVNVAAPGGGPVARFESPAGPQSPFALSVIAKTPGVYKVEVRPVEKWAAAGRYEIELEATRTPEPLDEKRLAARLKTAEGRGRQLLDTDESRRAAITSYEEALALWREAGDRVGEADTLQFIAQTHKAFGKINFDKAVETYNKALALRPSEEDSQARGYTLLGLAEVYLDLSNPANSLPYFEEARKLFEAANNQRGQADALYGMGLAKARRHEMPAALKDYEEALRIYGDPRARERHEEARTLHAIGGAYDVQGEPERALEFFARALEGWRETGDLARAGNTYSSIAKLDDDRGDWQSALDNYARALELYAQGEAAAERGKPAIRRTRASTLYNLAFTYAALGDYEKAFDLLGQSLELRDNPAGRGITLMMTGYVHALAGEPREALASCLQALPLQEAAGDPRKSQTYTVMGIAHAAQGEHKEALELYNRALEIQQDKNRPDPQAEAITQGRRGESLAALGAAEDALAAYGRARELWRGYKDRNGEALALTGMARVERRRGRLKEALKYVEDAIAAIEPLRANVTSQQLRVSYFAGKVDYYELYIDLCMRLGGDDGAMTAAAFDASERARSRSLLDVLSQARVEAGRKADTELAALTDKYRQLRREMETTKSRREQAPKEKAATDELDARISKLNTELEGAESRIQSRYPRYASLMYPQPLSAAAVQRLLDDDTLVLAFTLGEERSYVWALTASDVRGYTLPPRSEIETTTRRLLELLKAGQPLPNDGAAHRRQRMTQAEAAYWPEAAAFGKTLLGPASSFMKKRRILVVADGLLNYLPFGALPSPAADSARSDTPTLATSNAPLVKEHEIVNLPSASVLSVLRQTTPRARPLKSVAIFADPVFEKDDTRIRPLSRARGAAATSEDRAALNRAVRDMDGAFDASKLPRLPATKQEARDIASVVPPASLMEATDFQANRETATSPRLAGYSIVHFATHGIVNEKNPELSGVVLSLYDEKGVFHKEGFLSLEDIYGLTLPADLVVLSACRTGLGKDVRGEGLIGLTRGFMYAGASRVMATLWKVDDEATAELMKRFYEKMLKDGMTPAEALRAAQTSMSEQRRWSNPYYWAGFIIQGEPK
jgi:CHAT domain-containing protein/Tfp pilus assembly protein PilF